MRTTLRLASVLAIAAMIYSAIVLGFAIPGFYMVAFEGVPPGEPMHPEALAPTLAESALQIGFGASVLLLAIATRIFARRKLRTLTAGEQPPNNALEQTRDG